MSITPEDLSQIVDRESLFALLKDKLSWPLDPEDPYTYNEQEVAGRTSARAQVSRLIPFTGSDPFAIFLVEFATPFKRTDLREILRGVRQRVRERAAYNNAALESLVFVCATEDYNGLRFCHFEEREGGLPRLRTFGFDRDSLAETYTLRNVNLPALELTANLDWGKCRSVWLTAWDVEKVTRAFFDAYEQVFNATRNAIVGFSGQPKAKQLFTQLFFNRLLFIHFLSKRGWLTAPNGGTDYLRDLWAGRDTKESFYVAHLAPLFFAGLNNPQALNLVKDNPALHARIGRVPFLNGGLFEKTPEETSDIVIPDAVFATIFTDLFARYNFTITESSPDDTEVAVDPEMLGKVFEKLILKADREATGAFYTPRSVVQFMCRESLKGYLTKALPSPEKPDAIVRLVDEEDDQAISVREAKQLIGALERLRVVDPACGSGAFLLGMMQSIFTLMGQLDTRAANTRERDNYDRKLSIIQKNLYGVDLEPLAANIAMLRLWLSLIVDYRESAIDRLPPLPNLDFKIEVGDSLSAPDPRVQGDIFRSRALDDADALAKKKRDHFHAINSKKTTLAAEIRAEEAKIAAELAKNAAVALPTDSFDWRVQFIEVFKPDETERGEAGGFHIVIANPPYGGTPVPDAVRYRMFPRAEGSISKDLYGIFMGRALELLVPGGVACYIVSNTWRTIKSFKPLRVRLAQKTSLLHVLDLPNWIFEATVNTGIVTLTNTPPPAGHSLIAGDLTGIKKDDWQTLEANLRLIASQSPDIQTPAYARYTYPQATIATYENHSFFIASPKLYGLMSDARFTKLGTLADVKVGLQTGYNEYYLRKKDGVRGSYQILNEAEILTEKEIANLTDNEKQNGVDLKKYGGRFIVPFDKGGESEASEGWIPNYYVPTGYFIDWSKSSVDDLRTLTIADVKEDKNEDNKIQLDDNEKRAAVIRNPQYYFRKGVTFSPTGIYSPSFRIGCGTVFGNKGSTIFSDNISPEGVLGYSSNLIARYVLKSYLSHTVETGEEVLSQLPIPLLDVNITSQIETLISSIIEKQKADLRYPYHLHEQREIDALVYSLYGLTDDDIREVTLWYCRRYDKLARAQGVYDEAIVNYASYLERAEELLTRPTDYWRSHPLLTQIAAGEGLRMDFKEFMAVNPLGANTDGKHIAKAIAAFLNTDGGTVLIGVKDSGVVVGIKPDLAHVNRHNNDGFELKLRQILGALDPAPRGNIEVSFAPLPDGTVCVITVSPALGATYLDDKVYLRDGNRTVELSGRELVEWSAKRRGG
ncbi:Eco57I restriction-modification methylase domain-containing protein [Armatimonas sp.]|uniref:Eco57I restriction-modification methylase domain-containing protein n=1 Tax=Armatimonas sp. TaxID=1872638 RepID=UPI003750DDF1